MVVRPAVLSDVAAMRRVDGLAGRRFAEADDPRIAERAGDPPPSAAELEVRVRGGRAWVASDGDHEVVGFLVADVVDGNLHVEEVAVTPAAEGRGHGTALMDAVADAAARSGRPAVTLTTFSHLPWNRPWYERRGFTVLAPPEIGPELAARVRHEATHGLDPTLRVCMLRPLPAE